MERTPVNPWTWQDNFGFSQAVKVEGHSRTLVCSGQTSVDATGVVIYEGDVGAQVATALDNLEAVLSQGGFGLGDVVRLNLYTTDIDGLLAAFGTVGERLAKAECRPAMTLLGVTQLAFPGLMVELEATAMQ